MRSPFSPEPQSNKKSEKCQPKRRPQLPSLSRPLTESQQSRNATVEVSNSKRRTSSMYPENKSPENICRPPVQRWERCKSLALCRIMCPRFFLVSGQDAPCRVSVSFFAQSLIITPSTRSKSPRPRASSLSLAKQSSTSSPSPQPPHITTHCLFPSFGCPASWPFSISAIIPSKAFPTFSL
jgi:hypothetical protein